RPVWSVGRPAARKSNRSEAGSSSVTNCWAKSWHRAAARSNATMNHANSTAKPPSPNNTAQQPGPLSEPLNSRKRMCGPGLLQRTPCYLPPAEEAPPGAGTTRMQRMRPDLVNQSAARPPALLDLGRYSAGHSCECDPASVMLRGGTPWAPPPLASPG